MSGEALASPTLMARETAEAPAVVARQLAANAARCAALARRLVETPPRLVITCARGSSDHAATFAKYLVEINLGVPVLSAAPSVASVYRRVMDLRGCLFVVISQSGASPDLVANAAWARDNGATVVGLLNRTDSPVAEACHVVIPLHAGEERSVAATKSYIATLAAVLHLVSHLSPDVALGEAVRALPAHLEAARLLDWSEALAPLSGATDLLVAGRGPGLAVAEEAALKLKETAGIHAEAFSTAELQHGPLALVHDRYPVLVFSQEDETRPGVRALLDILRAKGARVLAAEPGPPATGRLPVVPGMHPAAAPVAAIQTFYGLANAVALARGVDPDRPPHLRKVTATR